MIRTLKKIAKWGIQRTPILDRMVLPSAGYKVLSRRQAEQFGAKNFGWHSSRSAKRQEQAYNRLLGELRAGHPRVDLKIAAEAVRKTGIANPSLLEVGCGNGYYYEVLQHLAPGVVYTGLDMSPAMVASAQERYPGQSFLLGDGTCLAFDDSSFDIVFDGVTLMHILNYERAIAEAARVARFYAVFNSVPVFDAHETVYLSKFAYGQPVVEAIFGRPQLESLFDRAGLAVRNIWPTIAYDVADVVGVHSYSLTYLCEKLT